MYNYIFSEHFSSSVLRRFCQTIKVETCLHFFVVHLSISSQKTLEKLNEGLDIQNTFKRWKELNEDDPLGSLEKRLKNVIGLKVVDDILQKIEGKIY